MTNNQKSIVAAPGKVLITGGYIVLDQRFSGFVVALDSYFQVEIAASTGSIAVSSPQFTDGFWEYEWANSLIEKEGRNPFVKLSLEITIMYMLSKRPIQPNGIQIKILADNDFYSQSEYLVNHQLPVCLESLQKIPKHNQTGTTVSKVNKTGLGSSAAMVTCLVAALLLHFGFITTEMTPKDVQVVEKLSHVVHCLAQGKIGSGFDVSAACHGNHIYKRFDPSILEPVLQSGAVSSLSGEIIQEIVDKDWYLVKKNSQLPPGLTLVMGEIKGGSNTPKMVSTLLKWRKENLDICEEMWNSLDLLQSKLVHLFGILSDYERKDSGLYFEELRRCSSKVISLLEPQTPIQLTLKDISTVYNQYRRLMKEMGKNCGVEVEPDEQSARIEQCLSMNGVLFAGVPGAGGYDALFCVCIGDESKRNLLNKWQETTSAIPLVCEQAQRGLHVR